MKRTSAVLFSAVVLGLGVVSPVGPSVADSGYISGSVTSANGDVDGGSIKFFASCEDFAAGTPAASKRIESGVYAGYVPMGTYRVLITPARDTHAITSWHSAATTCETSTPVVVTDNTEEDLDAIATAILRGAVTSANGPVQVGILSLFASCGTPLVAKTSVRSGTYSMELAPGTYLAQFTTSTDSPDLTAASSWHDAAASCETATQLVATPGIVSTDLRVLALYSMPLTVTSRSGPAQGSTIDVFTSCEAAAANSAFAQVDIDESVPVLRLPPGRYFLRITDDSGDKSWNGAVPTCAQSIPVSVSASVPVTLTIMARQSSPPHRLAILIGRKYRLSRATPQATTVSWKAAPRKICVIRKHRLIGRKEGICRVTAQATGSGYYPFQEVYPVRVQRPRVKKGG